MKKIDFLMKGTLTLKNPGYLEVFFGVHCNPVQGQYMARTGFSLCSKFSF